MNHDLTPPSLDEIHAIVDRRRIRRQRVVQRTATVAIVAGVGFAIVRAADGGGPTPVAGPAPTELPVPRPSDVDGEPTPTPSSEATPTEPDLVDPPPFCPFDADPVIEPWFAATVEEFFDGREGDEAAAFDEAAAIAADWGIGTYDAKAIIAVARNQDIATGPRLIDRLVVDFVDAGYSFDTATALAYDWAIEVPTVKALAMLGRPEVLAALDAC